MHHRIVKTMHPLRDAWMGNAADAFFQEMDAEVLPAILRLTAALHEASQVTNECARLLRDAEEEAAALFVGGEPPFYKTLHSRLPAISVPANPHPYGTLEWAQYGLLIESGIAPERYDSELGFNHNREMIVKGYDYYQRLFQENPDFWWMVFARSAVINSIFPAFITIDSSEELVDVYRRYFSSFLNRSRLVDKFIDIMPGPYGDFATFLLPDDGLATALGPMGEPELVAVLAAIDDGTITADDVAALSLEFTRMQHDIYMHMGALHYAYNEGGIELIRQMGESLEIDEELVYAFELIEAGDEASLAKAAQIMANYEQRTIIQKNYRTIAEMGPAGPLLLDAMSVMTVPAVPGGTTLRDVVPGGQIEDVFQRMEWINSEIAMWATLTDDQRAAIVNQPLPNNIPAATWALRAELLRRIPYYVGGRIYDELYEYLVPPVIEEYLR